jgi:predicted fused transcriptional regulator/phosphomethylpyrimidine kinase/predicted transcriptional regulator
LHAAVASELLQSGWSQNQVAEVIGTTQSSVSRWVTRPPTSLECLADEEEIDRAAAEIVAHLLRNGSPDGGMSITITTNNTLVTEFAISCIVQGEAGERARVPSELMRAVSGMPLIPDILRPAVGINLAACISNATESGDVAAFPGRLRVGAEGMLADHPPAFGVSRHLAALLLRLRSEGSDATAIVNLRPPRRELIQQFCSNCGLSLTLAPRGQPAAVADLLLDEGDFGWEPSLYLTAPSVGTLVERIGSLIEMCD